MLPCVHESVHMRVYVYGCTCMLACVYVTPHPPTPPHPTKPFLSRILGISSVFCFVLNSNPS